MRVQALEAFTFPVPFRTVVRHASARRTAAENLIVVARSDTGLAGYGEGCPRDYVTGETVAGGAAFIRQHAKSLMAEVADEHGLRAWSEARRPLIDRNPAAFCAVELALLDLFGKARGRPGGRPVGDAAPQRPVHLLRGVGGRALACLSLAIGPLPPVGFQ